MPAASARRAAPRRAPLPAIRWDRLARLALLCVLVGLVPLYVKPALSWVGAQRQAAHMRGEVAALQAERDRLEARRRALQRPGTLEREARRLGYVKAGEKAYVVEGLPGGR